MAVNDFIGVFEDALSKRQCEEIIAHYQYVNSIGRTFTRQEKDRVEPIIKETEMYFLDSETDPAMLSVNEQIVKPFSDAVWNSYNSYSKTYGVLVSLTKHRIYNAIKIQCVKPTQGYHVWHCEHDSADHGRRLLFAMAYLNDVAEGGETEFLYQSLRIKPKQGTLLLCPSGFTHTHRGNPPLSGDKYIINTWVEFCE